MSYVTNVILTFGPEWATEDEQAKSNMQKINDWLCENNCGAFRFPLGAIDAAVGGTKSLDCEIFVGAFNYLNVEGFADLVFSLSWEWPDEVQILVKNQDADLFSSLTTRSRVLPVVEGSD